MKKIPWGTALLFVINIPLMALLMRGVLPYISSGHFSANITTMAISIVAIVLTIILWQKREYIITLLLSERVAVITLILFSIACIVGTLILQKAHTHDYTDSYGVWGGNFILWLGINDIFHTGWFLSMMGLIGLEVFACLIARLPWKWRDAGFVLTHGGIVICLIGGLIANIYAYKGVIQVYEGEKVDVFYNAQTEKMEQIGSTVELVDFVKDLWPYGSALVLSNNKETKILEKNLTAPTVIMENETKIEVLEYLPYAKSQTILKATKNASPMVLLSINGDELREAFSPIYPYRSRGAFAWEAKWFDDKGDAEKWLISQEISPPSFAFGDLNSPSSVELPNDLSTMNDSILTPKNSDIIVEVLRGFNNFRIEPDEEGHNVPQDVPANGAVATKALLVRVSKGDIKEKRYVFAGIPPVLAGGGRCSKDIITAINQEPPHKLAFAILETGEVFYRDASGDEKPKKWNVGENIDSGAGTNAKLLQVLPSAKAFDNWVETTAGLPAARVRISFKDKENEGWLACAREGAAMSFPNNDVDLVELRVSRHPEVKDFASHIIIRNKEGVKIDEGIVRVNKPFVVGNYMLYQQDYDKDHGKYSVLGVRYDPAQYTVYAGCIMLMCGMFLMLWRSGGKQNVT